MSEPIRVLFNVSHQMPLGPVLAVYFFLTGISAAAFIISTLGYVFGKARFKPLGNLAALVAPVVFLAAPWFLLADLEQPLRFIHLFWMWNFRSPITWGTIVLTLYPAVTLIYLYFVLTKNLSMARAFGIAGIVVALGLEIYTGFIMAMGIGRPMWNSPLMPIYFLVSAMVSGVGLLILLAIVKERLLSRNVKINQMFPTISSAVMHEMGGILSILILADLVITATELAVMTSSRPAEQQVATILLSGVLSTLYLGVQVLLGLLIPLAVLNLPPIRRTTAALVVASGFAIVGVFAMRYVTILAGQLIPLN